MDKLISLPTAVKEVIEQLSSNGFQAYIVGGAVRDALLDRPVHDWDICTSATPDEMLHIFIDKRIIETGLQHGTITVVVDNMNIEVTTFRIDGEYSDNRKPDNVKFTNSLYEDLSRRDFTINAMAYNEESGLIDPFGGQEDLKNKKIRCVGIPKYRFEEDALRILRAIRFACQLGFKIDIETSIEIRRQYKRLNNISKERINSEFCKMIIHKEFCNKLIDYKKIFALFIPELNDMFHFPQNNPYHQFDVFSHTVQALYETETNDLIIKLAVFFHDFGKPHCYQDDANGIRHFKGHGKISAELANTIMMRLKFDNDTKNKVCELVHYHDATIEVGKKYVKRWLNKLGEEQLRRLLTIRQADIKGQKLYYDKDRVEKIDYIKTILTEVLEQDECFSLKDLAINGKDLIAAGFIEGKEIGNILSQLLCKVIDGELENEKNILFQHIITCIKNKE